VVGDDVTVIVPLLKQAPAQGRIDENAAGEHGRLDRMRAKCAQDRVVALLRRGLVGAEQVEVVHRDGDFGRRAGGEGEARPDGGRHQAGSEQFRQFAAVHGRESIAFRPVRTSRSRPG
jgi:hypothetical protein